MDDYTSVCLTSIKYIIKYDETCFRIVVQTAGADEVEVVGPSGFHFGYRLFVCIQNDMRQ